MSSLAWLAYSDHERRQALEVIKFFEEKGTVDELGIGVTRDAISDLLFPGTSVLQTRARYFLIIPWIYMGLENKRVRSADAEARGRKEEIALIDVLLASEDSNGTIGKLAKASLKLLPSFAYWQGLGRWGIRLFPGSQDQYHRSLDGFYAVSTKELSTDDGEPIEGRRPRNWHSGIPGPPPGWPKELSLRISKVEADYLQERILTAAPGTLLAAMVSSPKRPALSEFPWEHPAFDEFSAILRKQLAHARNFSQTMHGAAILYNRMLAEKSKREQLATEYAQDFGEWINDVQGRAGELKRWDRQAFWAMVMGTGARVTQPSRTFIDSWLDLAISAKSEADVDRPVTRTLIHNRERVLKKALARLDNQRALDAWQGASGLRQLNYRWNPVVRTVIDDIVSSLAA